MPIKVVVEFQAKPGARAELKKMLADISATHGPKAHGFLGRIGQLTTPAASSQPGAQPVG